MNQKSLLFIVILSIMLIAANGLKVSHKQDQTQSFCLITGNEKKLEEFKQILGDSFELTNEKIELTEIQGEPEEIAKHKALEAYEIAQKPILVEDTLLAFNAYKGLPGPYTKYFIKNLGAQGLAKMLDSFDDKTAYAQTIIAYMGPDVQEPALFIGKTQGTIVKPRGSLQFGWDAVFQPEGQTKTYAELGEEKNKISQRYLAIQAMNEHFTKPATAAE